MPAYGRRCRDAEGFDELSQESLSVVVPEDEGVRGVTNQTARPHHVGLVVALSLTVPKLV